MRLWLARHAEVTIQQGICYGATDIPADAGQTVAAATALAEQLQRSLSPTERSCLPIYVSTLGRAQQLATQLTSQLNLQLTDQSVAVDGAALLRVPVISDARLREIDFGCWELQRWEDIPRFAFDAWLADFANHPLGGVQSTQQFIHQVADALFDTLLSCQAHGHKSAVWITHAGVIRAVHYLMQHGRTEIASAAQWPKTVIAPGGYLLIETIR